MTDPGDLAHLNRAIGRIEGQNKEVINKLNAMILDMIRHQTDDRVDFQAIRDLVEAKLDKQREDSDGANALLATRIADLEKQNEREKGAGWVIVSLIGASVSALGTMAWAIFSGHIIWKP
jgi:hypothetical protein